MTRDTKNSPGQPADEVVPPANDSDQHPLDRIAEEFAARCRAGEKVSINQFLQQYPQWATELRDLLSSIALMEKLKAHGSGRRSAYPLPPPQRLGDFRIIREVGRGGMGIVYEAFEQSLGRHVAVKILSAPALIDPRQLQRFHREAQAAGRLHHTNIVPVFGASRVDDIHFYVMQFIDGRALNQILAHLANEANHPAASANSTVDSRAAGAPQDVSAHSDSGPAPSILNVSPADVSSSDVISLPIDLPPRVDDVPRGRKYWQWVADAGCQVAGALDYAHQQGTLHRDVKPANLLLDARGTVWITDFGLAKLTGPRDVTQSGDVIGTLQYLAPEALHGHADARSDIYSLGLTLYELLTLKAPIQGDTPAATLRAVEHAIPIAPRRINAEIPRDLETIVLKAIARDPRSRYQTAAALAQDLESFLQDRPIAARRISMLERLWRWCRRNRALALATGAAIAAMLLALIVGWAGYVKTRDALAAERNALAVEAQRRSQADRATARAEQNMHLSLQAFEDIFNQVDQQRDVVLDPPPPDEGGRPPDRERNGPADQRSTAARPVPPGGPRPGNSSFDADILRSILAFYDKFSRENATNPMLDAEAARAYQRIGDLYFRMGDQSAAAQEAYARAAAMYDHLRRAQGQVDVATLIGFADAVSSMSPGEKLIAGATSAQTAPATLSVVETALAADLLARRDQLIAVLRDLRDIVPASNALSQRQAATEARLAEVDVALNDTAAAKDAYQHALDVWRGLPPVRPPGPPIATPQAADAALALATLLLKENETPAARAVLYDAAHLGDSRRAEVPPGQREKVARLDDALAAVDRLLSNPREADEASREARRLRSRPREPGRDRPPGGPPPPPEDDGHGPSRGGPPRGDGGEHGDHPPDDGPPPRDERP